MVFQISIAEENRVQVIRLRAALEDGFTQLQSEGITWTVEEFVQGDQYIFSCQVHAQNYDEEREARYQLGKGLSMFICECKDPELIRGIINREYSFLRENDIIKIENQVLRQLETSVWEYARILFANRREKLAKQIALFLKEFPFFSVEGFVRFRMKAYRKTLSKCVQDAVDDFLLDQEYQEFIQLLRYFISVQPSRISIAQVIHDHQGRYRLVQDDGTPIQLDEIDQSLLEILEHTFSDEDFLVSSLLSLAPERVILHTQDPEENLVRTLVQIFEGRIMLCHGCSQCGYPLNFQGDA
ncbi:putative sporulation protein YtxC [Hazenella coriacea]|uniref:Putative sporulation protein YtxC n=1 Tax=Hazenella coriacea TaxID=1179467 RepID=A0A4R3LBU4_9BACL|nr:putative sporulation protein YtxC [Hazenella coriacea]TCS96710.1 putative sporulation protein YtxC [Hazenella coriacea]